MHWTDVFAECNFACAQCNKTAGTVCIVAESKGPAVVVHSCVSRATTRVTPREADRLCKIVSRADIQALYRHDPEYAPFFCPRCTTCYCGDHWVRWDVFEDDGWHDSIRGRCPSGHERKLED